MTTPNVIEIRRAGHGCTSASAYLAAYRRRAAEIARMDARAAAAAKAKT